jgi:pyridoxamine 5'-phosphate oxidase
MKDMTPNRDDLSPDPITQFTRWFDEAVAVSDRESAEAMCLSTMGSDGFPDGRMVLLKRWDETGFVFYTNAHSVKGRALDAIPKAALTFHCIPLKRQVRIQGKVARVSHAEADAYFATRARESQIGAWASDQSATLESREALDAKVAEFTKKFEGQAIPRPPHWTGYRVIPTRIEFWQGQKNRLHDRFQYSKTPGGHWAISRLNP